MTVVLPTRDRAQLLRRSLGTALRQKGLEFEVLVVDDGSVDGTPQLLERLAEPRLRYLRSEVSMGVSSARNLGIAEARGDWIAFLDDDDVWAPEKLATQLEAVARSDTVLGYTGSVYVDEDCHPIRLRRLPEPDELPAGLLSTNLIGGPSTVMVRAATVRDVGGFDEHLEVLADWDLWLRVLQHGTAAASREILVGYTLHEANMHSRQTARIRGELAYLRLKHRELAQAHGTTLGGPDFSLWLVRRYRVAGRRLDAAREYASLAVRRRRPRHLLQAAAMLVSDRIRLADSPRAVESEEVRWLPDVFRPCAPRA